MASSSLIAKLTVLGVKDLLPPICAFVRELAIQEGIAEEQARGLELVAEEACLNVIQHALQGSHEFFDVCVERRPAQFVVAIEDRGLPIDWKKVESGKASGLGMMLMKSFSDQVHFINLGKGGKRIEFIKDFQVPGFGGSELERVESDDHAPELAPMDIPITFRKVMDDDLVALARCMYQVYGYSYKEEVYYPEKMKELIDHGLLFSTVAVTPDGEIVAHQGLRKEQPEAHVAEITMGMVDPRFRGRRLFERIKTHAYEDIKKYGVYGLYVEIVANHPYSQKANEAMGAKTTGILVGYISPDRVFRGITKELERVSAVLAYTRLAREPRREGYPPFHHETMVRKIYENGDFERIIMTASPENAGKLPARSLANVKSVKDTGNAFIKVLEYGEDIELLIRDHLRVLCINKFDCIFLDLPLSDPSTQRFCMSFELLGFFFAGLIPELPQGDVLRLQYLNNITIDPNKVVLTSDFNKEMFEYVLHCWGMTKD